ncbi:MAG: polyribonucleotide nucleotidyltransferase [Planctomycetes bacterium]|nr:polyribonucleotide nucleotidyltransferase [Planctomycetota bacterium]
METGLLARQAAGSIVVTYGETSVLATVCHTSARPDITFFPLTVDYREKTYAAGKIPGGFFKREGRPTTKETLTMRLIDRSIRPMFPEGMKTEVQVMTSVLVADPDNDPDTVAMMAAFAAVHLSDIPFKGAMGAVRIGHVDGKLVVNPTTEQLLGPESKLDLVIAATPEAICMVEAGAREIDEDTMVDALELGHAVCRDVADLADELRELAPHDKFTFEPDVRDEKLVKNIERSYVRRLRDALLTPGKHERKSAVKELQAEVVEKYLAKLPRRADEEEIKKHEGELKEIFEAIVAATEREMILEGTRADGRTYEQIRPLDCRVSMLPRVHGTGLFTRGETQALVAATLGSASDQQIVDGLGEEYRKKFMLHYNFPPFSVGEVKPLRGASRREIGHGALAERALVAVLPPRDRFPYTIRLVSEILESNGSSSMASVCGGTLALMDAGVPIRQPVAGIAMGLIMDDRGQYAILTDIQGSEDHNGDMDFKVAGTGLGITALQMDIKITGISRKIMKEALEQARRARLEILRSMLGTLGRPRADVSRHAPRLVQLNVPPEKISFLIGPGGKNIKRLQEQYRVSVDIVDESGVVQVFGADAELADGAVREIRALTEQVELGKTYRGRVKSIKPFGAFVEILPGEEGLCPVSELSTSHVRQVSDVVNVGDELEVKVISVDDHGKVRLSHRAVLTAREGGEAVSFDHDDGDRDRDHDRDHGRGRGRDRDHGRGGRDRDRDRDRGRGRDRDRQRDDASEGRDRGRGRDDRRHDRGGRDRDDRGSREREDRGRDQEDRGSRDRDDRDQRGRDRDRQGESRRGGGRDRNDRGRDRQRGGRDGNRRDRDEFTAPVETWEEDRPIGAEVPEVDDFPSESQEPAQAFDGGEGEGRRRRGRRRGRRGGRDRSEDAPRDGMEPAPVFTDDPVELEASFEPGPGPVRETFEDDFGGVSEPAVFDDVTETDEPKRAKRKSSKKAKAKKVKKAKTKKAKTTKKVTKAKAKKAKKAKAKKTKKAKS